MNTAIRVTLSVLSVVALSGCEIDTSDPCQPCCSSDGDEPFTSWCEEHSDCPPGEFCGERRCVSVGFCAVDLDCPIGFVCDERETCVPHGIRDSCDKHHDCAMGSYCGETARCIGTSMCCTDQACGWENVPSDCLPGFQCDDERLTCMPCAGGVCPCKSNTDCPPGEHCDIQSGSCYLPSCEEISLEEICVEREDCRVVYVGINCTSPEGAPCTDPAADCSCEEYDFAECESR